MTGIVKIKFPYIKTFFDTPNPLYTAFINWGNIG